ncbi:MAG: hypothetical protein CMP77_16600 [Flavobacterium sp.]|nr:hypothetical protein [Flavobacterium sp.]
MEWHTLPFRAKQSEVEKSLYKTRDSSTAVGMENIYPKFLKNSEWNTLPFRAKQSEVEKSLHKTRDSSTAAGMENNSDKDQKSLFNH